MKLSFSTKGWHGRSFEDFCDIAKDMKFEGIELHNIHNPLFTEKDGAFYNLKDLYEDGNISEESVAEIEAKYNR